MVGFATGRFRCQRCPKRATFPTSKLVSDLNLCLIYATGPSLTSIIFDFLEDFLPNVGHNVERVLEGASFAAAPLSRRGESHRALIYIHAELRIADGSEHPWQGVRLARSECNWLHR